MIVAIVTGIVLLVLAAAGTGYAAGRGSGEEDRGALADELCRARLRARVLEQELERRAGVDVLAWSALANSREAVAPPLIVSDDPASLEFWRGLDDQPAVETTGAHEFGEWLRERIADTDRFMSALDEEIPG